MTDSLYAASQRSRLDLLAQGRGAAAVAWAHEVHVLVDLHDIVELDHETDGIERFCKNELSGTMRLTLSGAHGAVQDALRMRDVLGMTLWDCENGRVWVAQALVLLHDTRNSSRQVAQEVERILRDNGSMQLDPSTLRRRLRKTLKAVEALLEPEETATRERDAIDERYAAHFPREDGMAAVMVTHTADRVLRHKACLAELVALEREADLERGIDRTDAQRAADILIGLPAEHLALQRLLQDLRNGEVTDQLAESAGLTPEAAAPTGGARAATEPVPPAPLGLFDPELPEPSEPTEPADPFATRSILNDLLALIRRPSSTPGPGPRVCTHGTATEIVVHLPFATLLGFSHDPATLQGHGPISAAQALVLVPDAKLRLVAVDKYGTPVHVEDRTFKAGPDLTSARRAATDWYAQYGEGDGRLNEAARAAVHWHAQTKAGQPLTPPPPGPSTARAERSLPHEPTETTETTGSADPTRPAPRPLFAIDNPEPQYVPSARLARLVNLRDPVCTGIGCNRPARLCDKDHERPYRLAGATAAFNLRPKSRHCHRAKTISWQCRRSRTGTLTWTSPLGLTYRKPGFWDPPPDWDPHLTPPTPRPRYDHVHAPPTDGITELTHALGLDQPTKPPTKRTRRVQSWFDLLKDESPVDAADPPPF